MNTVKIYKKKINEIKTFLSNYYENERKGKFINDEENYKENLRIKNIIKELLINLSRNISISEPQKQLQKNEIIKLLAENTGCVDDCKISKIIINELLEKNAINQSDLDYYYLNENTGRWQ